MFAAIFCGSIVAQEQGQMLIDGSVGLNFESDNESETQNGDQDAVTENLMKMSTLDLDLTGGYFLMDGLALGLSIDMNQVTTEQDGVADTKGKYTTTMFGPMVRYYVGETGVFGQLSYLMGSGKSDSSGDKGTKMSSLGIGAWCFAKQGFYNWNSKSLIF